MTVSGTNVEATLENGEAYVGTATVWYSWTAPVTANYQIRLLNFNYNLFAQAFTGGSLGTLTPVVAGSSEIVIPATAGTTYQIVVYGRDNSEKKFDLNIRQHSIPANDHFANRVVVSQTLPVTLTGSNVEATMEKEETYPEVDEGSSVWYSWTAPADGGYEISLLNPGFKPTLNIYTGNVLKSLAGFAYGHEREAIVATAGKTYHIAVMGRDGEQGDFQLSIRGIVPPENDHFANSVEIPAGLPASQSGWNGGATLEPGESHPQNYENKDAASVWYHWTAPSTGKFEIKLAEENFSGILKAYTGDTLATLQFAGAGDRITVTAMADTVYQIAVLGNSSFPSSLQGEYRITIRNVTPALNDNFANTIVLPGAIQVSRAGSNFEATLETGEPDQWYDGASVWYRWTAPSAGRYEFKITTADFSTELFVFTGNSLNTLFRLPTQKAWTTVNAAAGTTYQIAVHGTYGVQGNFQLAIRSVPPPANDNFATSTLLTGSSPSAGGNTINATLESLEPSTHADYGSSVWYHWTAPSTGNYEVSLPNSTYGSTARVYRGNTLDELTLLGTGTSQILLAATSGTVYRIAVLERFDGQPGAFQLRIRAFPGPANNNFASRTVVATGMPAYLYGSNLGATAENFEPDTFTTDKTSVWYRWTAPATGNFELRTLSGEFTPKLLVLTGDSLMMLNREAMAESKVIFEATEGTTYQFMVNGSYGQQGKFQLMLSQLLAPVNDHFANRIEIPVGLPVTVAGSYANSTLEPDEPNPGDYGGSGSVWYRWTAPATGSFRFGFLGESFSPLVRIFTGDSLGTLVHVGSDYGYKTVATTAGTVYQIAVRSGQTDFRLIVQDLTPPVNNLFVNRITIPAGLPVSVAGSNVNANMEASEPNPGWGGGATIWYRWTAPATGYFRITTLGSNFDTMLQISTGTSVDALLVIITNDDDQTETSKVSIHAQQGVEYQIAIHGYKAAMGSTVLNIARGGITDWAGAHGLVGANSMPGATPKADEVPNLLKYAFNMPPGTAASGAGRYLSPESGTTGLPFISQVDGVLTIEYLRSLTATDLNYRPQFSSTLAPDGAEGWLDAEGTEEVVPADSGWERVIIRDVTPGAIRFGRVVVEAEAGNP